MKAKPGMTIRESFESDVERQLNPACDQSGQYAQKHLKEDNNVKQMVVAGSKGSISPRCLSVSVSNRWKGDEFRLGSDIVLFLISRRMTLVLNQGDSSKTHISAG